MHHDLSRAVDRRRSKRRCGLALTVVILTVSSGSAAPASAVFEPVVVDPSFASVTGGFARLPVDEPIAVEQVIELADGSVLVDATSGDKFDPTNLVVKLRPDGSLDTSFGATGATPGIVDTFIEGGGHMAVDSQGRIVVGGRSYVAWLLPDGTPDPSIAWCPVPCSFDSEPPPPLRPGTSVVGAEISSLAVVSGDAVLVSTRSAFNGSTIELVKLTATGQRDMSFGVPTANRVAIDGLGNSQMIARADGRIVVFAESNLNADDNMFVFEADGAPAKDFGGGDGAMSVQFGGDATDIASVTPIDAERILVATYVSFPAGSSALHVLTWSGEFDSSFGSAGHVDIEPLGAPTVPVVGVRTDGRLVVSVPQPDETIGLAQLTADGRLDASFGTPATPGWYRLPQLPPVDADRDLSALTIAGDHIFVGIDMSFLDVMRLSSPSSAPIPIPFYRLSDGYRFPIQGPATPGSVATRLGHVDIP